MNILYSLQHLGYTIPPQADAGWIGEAGPGPSYLDPGSGGPDNDFTNRNTTFMTWNLLHLARMLKDAGGIPAHGNQRSRVGRRLPVRLRQPRTPLSRRAAGWSREVAVPDVSFDEPAGRRRGRRAARRCCSGTPRGCACPAVVLEIVAGIVLGPVGARLGGGRPAGAGAGAHRPGVPAVPRRPGDRRRPAAGPARCGSRRLGYGDHPRARARRRCSRFAAAGWVGESRC